MNCDEARDGESDFRLWAPGPQRAHFAGPGTRSATGGRDRNVRTPTPAICHRPVHAPSVAAERGEARHGRRRGPFTMVLCADLEIFSDAVGIFLDRSSAILQADLPEQRVSARGRRAPKVRKEFTVLP